ncbi:T9SS type A sorting domain-containing protein [Aurantibacter aestuarii]|nr:T9SS type A sorting domain-containing protein [Aurantibacter aestuarii]
MRKITLLLSFLFCLSISYAQLNVRNNAYIYVDDEIVFVENNVNLQETTTNFYLRNEAQLIQGNQTIANSGDGDLSQLEPVKNDFYSYNAWALPVGQTGNPSEFMLASEGTAANGFIETGGLNFVNGYTPNNAAATSEMAKYWLWAFLPGSVYADWDWLGDLTTTIDPGYGFLMKGAYVTDINNSLDFRGLPNSADVLIDVNPAQFTLAGNPYPSALDALDFIHEPANAGKLEDGTLYYYIHNGNGSHNLLAYQYAYATYTINAAGTVETKPDPAIQNADITGNSPTPATGNYTNPGQRYISISQGFFVQGDSLMVGSDQLIFRNSHRNYVKRSDPTSTTARSSNSNSSLSATNFGAENLIQYNAQGYSIMPAEYKRFRFNVTFINQKVKRQLIHTFGDHLTPGKDYGYETRVSPVNSTDAYFFNVNRKLNSIADAYDVDMKIPFALKLATDQVINFGLKDVQNFEANQPIYLHDLNTDEYFNIATNDHQMSLPAGDYSSRFEITFKNNEQVLSVIENELNDFNIYQNNNVQTLNILNPNRLDVSNVALYDVTGKQIFKSLEMNTKQRFEVSTSNLSDGVYIVKVDFESGASTSKKLVIGNKN